MKKEDSAMFMFCTHRIRAEHSGQLTAASDHFPEKIHAMAWNFVLECQPQVSRENSLSGPHVDTSSTSSPRNAT